MVQAAKACQRAGDPAGCLVAAEAVLAIAPRSRPALAAASWARAELLDWAGAARDAAAALAADDPPPNPTLRGFLERMILTARRHMASMAAAAPEPEAAAASGAGAGGGGGRVG